MNAQTEQLIYWKQQYDLIRQERDDITNLCAATEQRLEKAVDVLKKVKAWVDTPRTAKWDLPYSPAWYADVLAAIEEPTDA